MYRHPACGTLMPSSFVLLGLTFKIIWWGFLTRVAVNLHREPLHSETAIGVSKKLVKVVELEHKIANKTCIRQKKAQLGPQT